MERRAISARDVLRRHSWAIGLLEARRTPAPAALRYLDAILGNLRSAGFSLEDAAHVDALAVPGRCQQRALQGAGRTWRQV